MAIVLASWRQASRFQLSGKPGKYLVQAGHLAIDEKDTVTYHLEAK